METDTDGGKAAQAKRPSPRFVKFSLRTVLILAAAFAFFLSWLVIPAQRQKAARLWVEGHRGWYAFESPYHADDDWYQPSGGLPIPRFAIDWFGIDTFASVTFVGFDADEIDDLRPLVGFSNLEELYINQFVHPQTDFTVLRPLSRLRTIELTKWSGVELDELEAISVALGNVEIVAEAYPDFAGSSAASGTMR